MKFFEIRLRFFFSCERDPGCHGITFHKEKCYKLMDSGGSVLAATMAETIPSLLFNCKRIFVIKILDSLKNLFSSVVF